MYIGVDIGGTKCAVVYGNDKAQILKKIKFETTNFEETIRKIIEGIDSMMDEHVLAIGISCGGPLDSRQGIIMAPPSLPDWVDYHIVSEFRERYHIPVYLLNDADACAIAEWKYGAGKGYENLIFLTFGTGIGAGLILNNSLYSGTCDGAGEIGHVRLYEGGHVGYRKAGSVEGYCSGSGIAQYGMGTAKILADKARAGEKSAVEIFEKVGSDFGKSLAILIDILNPQVIIAGSIYERCSDLLEKSMWKMIREEAIERNRNVVKVEKTMLGDNIGDVAALCVAMQSYQTGGRACTQE